MDPFFSGNSLHGQFMMNDPFEDFYGRRQRLALGGGGSQGLSPFGMTDPFQRMNEMMREMQRMSSMAANGGGGCQTFSQQSVMHFSHDSRPGEQPRVYQASTSTRSGPDGVKETRKMERDSVSATQKTSVGHHIGDRSHTINKKYDYKTKEAEQIQELVNLDEDDAQQFDAEWKQKSQKSNKMLHSGRPLQPSGGTLGLPSSSHYEPVGHHSSHHAHTGPFHHEQSGQLGHRPLQPSRGTLLPSPSHYEPVGHHSSHNRQHHTHTGPFHHEQSGQLGYSTLTSDGGPSRHGTEQRNSPRFNPYLGAKQTHDTIREEHGHHYSQSSSNNDTATQSQRAKKKKSSKVKFQHEHT